MDAQSVGGLASPLQAVVLIADEDRELEYCDSHRRFGEPSSIR